MISIETMLQENVTARGSFKHELGVYEAKFLRYEKDLNNDEVAYFYFSLNGNVNDTARIRVGLTPIVKKSGEKVTETIKDEKGNIISQKDLSGLDLMIRFIINQLTVEKGTTLSGAEVLQYPCQIVNTHYTVDDNNREFDTWSFNSDDIQAFEKRQILQNAVEETAEEME